MASSTKPEGPTVCVIGCGPAGLFFLHALATRRRTMEEACDSEGLRRLPVSVVCYERSSSPGGVWRAERNHDDDDDRKEDLECCGSIYTSASSDGDASADTVDTVNQVSGNMYEALWTNGAKERIEFFDYTYEDHFGKGTPLPTYMPRQPLLEYFVARVTRNNPTFFDDVRFDTTVVFVTYSEERCKFLVTTERNDTGERETVEFDKVIWGAGDHGKPSLPGDMDAMLKKDGYRGKIIHSSKIGAIDFHAAINGKNVLLVGDAYSAEDLALVAIKAGAERVYIQSRSGEGLTNYISSWPGNKVEIIVGFMPTGVIKDGHGIRFQEMEYDTKEWKYNLLDEGKTRDVEDISVVIYCTGYQCNLSMIDKSLKKPFVKCKEFHSVPKDWKMKPNVLSDDLGDVPPSEYIESYNTIVVPGTYRGLLMSNPSMMYILQESSAPLFEIDVHAWLCLAYICGDAEIPSRKEMKRRNARQIMDEMDVPDLRYMIDGNYCIAWGKLDEDHWSKNPADPRSMSLVDGEQEFHLRVIARDMKDALYPDDIGTYDQFNAKGHALLRVETVSWRHRIALDKDGPDAEWMTFRDADPEGIESVHTGAKAAPLRKRWLDLGNHDYDDLLAKKGDKI